MLLHPKQKEIARSNARFKVIRAGRRGGKTKLETETMAYKGVSGKDRNVFYIAPTQKQARSIIWESLKGRIGEFAKVHESRLEMIVPTQDGGKSHIFVAGWENRENFRGQPAHHITFDETDTMRDFFIGWQEIFRPALIDTGGTADFIGTPKKENPNLRRLEKQAETDSEWAAFHFTSWDNPHLPRHELEKAREEMDAETYQQEIMAEYVENAGALFRYTSLVDMFTNTIDKSDARYLTIDVADDGTDSTVFTYWEGLEFYRIEQYQHMNTEAIIAKVREIAAAERIPYSNIIVDTIGVGAAIGSSSLLNGIIPFKSSHQPIRTDVDPVRLPNVHYTNNAPLTSEYKNLRSQCVFTLAQLVNNHEIAGRIGDVRVKEQIIEELASYQDASKGDGKRFATPKEDVKAFIGRSPDKSDTLLMRMYFVIRDRMLPEQSEDAARVIEQIQSQFKRTANNQSQNSSR